MPFVRQNIHSSSPPFLKSSSSFIHFFDLVFIRKSIFQRFFYATQYCNSSSGDVAVAKMSVALSGVSCDNTFDFFFFPPFMVLVDRKSDGA